MRKEGLLALIALVARWCVGAWFIYLGLSKAMHPVEFLKLVRQYQIVSNPLMLNSIAAFLPWFEVFCGTLLVAGIAVRGSALVSLGLLVAFTVAVLKRGLAIVALQRLPLCAVKFDCGCGTGEVFICHKFIENGFLIVLLALLTMWPSGLLCLRFSLLRAPTSFHLS
jgi:uncharacterized membrane protein YphA (DoxX/SURF4 family)